MSSPDAYQGEMARLSKLSERDLDRILAGQAPADAEETGEDLTAFVRALRESLEAPPGPGTEQRHLAEIVQTSQLLADKGEPAVRPASKAHEPAPQVFGLPKWRRKLMPAGLFATLTAKVAGVAVAAAVATGGLAAGGVLPDPAQEAVSNLLGTVGIHVPDGDGDFSPAPLEEGSTAAEHADPTATAVLGAVDGWYMGEFSSGCEFARAVAAAAGADTGDAEACPTPGEEGEDGKATGDEKSEAGKAKGDEASSAGKAKGDDASSSGKATGDEASSSGKATGDEASSSGKATGDEASSSGQSTGDEASSSGKATGDEASSSGQSTGQDAAGAGTANNPTGKP